MTSGSSRSAARSARSNESVSKPTSRWFTTPTLCVCTYSIGSSIERMWHRALLVDVVDHRRERRRLARAGRPGHEHEALRQAAEVLAAPRQEQLVERRDLERDRPQRQRHDALLDEAVATEAVRVAVREGEVDLLASRTAPHAARWSAGPRWSAVMSSGVSTGWPSIGPRRPSTRMRGCVCAVSMRSVALGGGHRPEEVLDRSDVDG